MKDHIKDIKKSAEKSLDELDRGVVWLDSDPDSSDRWGRLDTVAKRFEVAFEYFWKYLKAAVEREGTEAPGPRPAITGAVQYGWIEKPEIWAGFLEARNAGVHDYFGLSSEEYAQKAREFLLKARKLMKKIPEK